MKLGIMQPYFLPYIGYISLMKCIDRWIFMDEVQMIRHGWIQRNRILRRQGGWHYIQVPLEKHKSHILIKDIRIRNNEPWKEKILAQLVHYKTKAPFYFEVIKLLKDSFQEEFDSITYQNAYLLKKLSNFIGFEFDYEILSEMNLNLEPIEESDDWSLNICKELNIKHYVNPIMGKTFYNTEKFHNAGIKINFLNKKLFPYEQKNIDGTFLENLSIIDVLMFNSAEEVLKRLDNYVLE
jgi:hypothetical protein